MLIEDGMIARIELLHVLLVNFGRYLLMFLDDGLNLLKESHNLYQDLSEVKEGTRIFHHVVETS
jgi:hypothetical protein